MPIWNLSARAIVLACCLITLVPAAYAVTPIFSETFESHSNGGTWSGTNGWIVPTSPSGLQDADIVDTPVFAGALAGRLDHNASGSEGVQKSGVSAGPLPADPDNVWVELYLYPQFTAVNQQLATQMRRTTSSRLQFYLLPNTQDQVDANTSTVWLSGAALAATASDFVANDEQWLHAVVEIDFNGAASTARLYVRQKTAGDSSQLNPTDIAMFGANDFVTFSWDGTTRLDNLLFRNSAPSGTDRPMGSYDNIAVYDSSPIAHPGDANGDGMVNLSDLQILGDNWQSTSAGWLEADFTGDNAVNLSDLQIIGDNWGYGTGPDLAFDDALALAGIAIPEPASWLLMSLLGSGLLRRRATR